MINLEISNEVLAIIIAIIIMVLQYCSMSL